MQNASTSATMKWFALHIFSVQFDICNKTNTFEYFEVSDASSPVRRLDSETVEEPPVIFLLFRHKQPFRLRLCAINPFENSLSSSKRLQLTKANCCLKMVWLLLNTEISVCAHLWNFFESLMKLPPAGTFTTGGRCGSSKDSCHPVWKPCDWSVDSLVKRLAVLLFFGMILRVKTKKERRKKKKVKKK